MAACSAVGAGLVSRRLFPLLSSNDDEAIYRLQAQTIASGHLFPAAPHPAGSFTPWLAALVDHHYVLKYTPFISGLLAASLKITGSFLPALALVAASAVGVTYALAQELLADRWAAVLAAGVVAASPLVIIQSGMLLAYLPTMVLLELFIWLLVRGLRTEQAWTLVASGLALGLAAAIRPYDAALLAAPILIWAAVGVVRRHRLAVATWWITGALVPIAALLAFDVAATGHALRLPFGMLEHKDSLGFGVRRLYPGDAPHKFGIAQGLAALRAHAALLVGWVFAGVLFIPATFFSLRRGRTSAPEKAVLGGVALFIVGYIGFWGTWNAVHWWGGAYYLGPFYLLPVLIGVSVVGARGVTDLLRRRSVLARALLAVTGLLSAVVLVGAVGANETFTHQDQALARLVHSQADPAVVFVDVDPPFLMHPSAVIANTATLRNDPLFAVTRGADDFTVLGQHPERTAYRLRLAVSGHRTPHAPWSASLDRLKRVDGAPLRLDLRLPAPRPGAAVQLIVTWRTTVRTYLPELATDHVVLTADATTAAVDGMQPDQIGFLYGSPSGYLSLDLRSLGGQLITRTDVPMVPAAPGPAPGGVEAILPDRHVASLGVPTPPMLGVSVAP